MSRIIITALLLALSPLSYADCESVAEKLSKTLNLPVGEPVEWGDSSKCKVWPADPAKTIVAWVGPPKNSNPDATPSEGVYDLEVLIVKTESGAVSHRLLQKNALSSDAISLRSISIDTARYALASGVLAFGVRANRSARNADVQTINLYVIQGNKLKLILSNLLMVEHFSETQLVHDCYRSSKTVRTLAIASTNNHGYSDLILQQKTTIEEPVTTAKDCTVTETNFSQQYILRFDGTAYVVPKELREKY